MGGAGALQEGDHGRIELSISSVLPNLFPTEFRTATDVAPRAVRGAPDQA